MLSSMTTNRRKALRLGSLIRLHGYAKLGKSRDHLVEKVGIPDDTVKRIVDGEIVFDSRFGEISAFSNPTMSKVIGVLKVSSPDEKSELLSLVRDLVPRPFATHFVARGGRHLPLDVSLSPEERQALYPSTAMPKLRKVG